MNITLKNIPEEVCEQLRRAAAGEGRSLNSQLIQLLTREASEVERRQRMRKARKQLERFVASLPNLPDSTKLIREDRER
ncbi:MAG: FitA-like ribbon-helix-helix domain-containing protein [Bryobacteraceae bacterium]